MDFIKPGIKLNTGLVPGVCESCVKLLNNEPVRIPYNGFVRYVNNDGKPEMILLDIDQYLLSKYLHIVSKENKEIEKYARCFDDIIEYIKNEFQYKINNIDNKLCIIDMSRTLINIIDNRPKEIPLGYNAYFNLSVVETKHGLGMKFILE